MASHEYISIEEKVGEKISGFSIRDDFMPFAADQDRTMWLYRCNFPDLDGFGGGCSAASMPIYVRSMHRNIGQGKKNAVQHFIAN